MDRDTAQVILAACMDSYRKRTHTELASRLRSSHGRARPDVIQGTTPDVTDYTIEINLAWDDRSRQHIRVMGDLMSADRGCLFGFLPVFTPEASDGFIVQPFESSRDP